MASGNIDDIDSEFYRAYGRAMASWSELERGLGSILVSVTGLSPKLAGAIYYSAKSFQGRADMVLACIPFAKTVPAGRAFLTKLVNRAVAYSSIRNALAHNRHMMHVLHGRDGDLAFELSIVAPDGIKDLTLQGIVNAAHNFTYLNQILVLSMGRKKLIREPELSLALLDLMPHDPVATAVDLTAANALAKEIEQFPH